MTRLSVINKQQSSSFITVLLQNIHFYSVQANNQSCHHFQTMDHKDSLVQLHILILSCDNAVVRVWLGQGKQITQDQENCMFWFKVPNFLNINTPAKSSSTSLSGSNLMLTIVALSPWSVVSRRAIRFHGFLPVFPWPVSSLIFT